MAVFNEDTRVKIPAAIQFLRLGYEYQSLKDMEIDSETKIAVNRFKPALEKLNGKTYTLEETAQVLSEINSVIKNNDLGKEFYHWLIHHGHRPKLIDFEHPENNDFAIVCELWFGEERTGSFRPDINILVNGIPLAFLEVKKPNNEGGIQREFRRMLNERLQIPEFRKYFNMFQLVAFSNNMPYENDDDAVSADEIRAGSFYSTPNGNNTTFQFFRDETPKMSGFSDISLDTVKYVLKDNHYNASESDTPEFQVNNDPFTPCNAFVTSLFDKGRLLYYLHYGITFVDGKVPEKHIMRYPQYFAAIAIEERLQNGGKSGIIFHTQGSGKTELAASSVRILRDYYAKKNITARFYYVVDRIDLLTQVSNDMSSRGLSVTNVDSKKDFEDELNKPLARVTADSDGELTVVNIQKFDSDMPISKNAYDINIQRVFFIDEAHRSYRLTGEYFKNLMLCDRDGVYIAMTGTPLLSKKERSNLKFGDYIHKYFYDKSIADGYTLRIKKEQIQTTARDDIRKNLELENPDIDASVIKESPAYINSLGRFIDQDFNYFRLTNNDPSIGGMIVCCSNSQAKRLKEWFDQNSQLETGLVITDAEIPTARNKATQLAFKNTLKPDILIVNQMLTTGYDVRRLKKMYLMRNAKEHSLLQTISRVNRPYKNPQGTTYKFGYIVDFVDIQQEYDRTIEAYLKEMQDDFGDADNGGMNSLAGLIVGPEDINKKYLDYKKTLDGMVDTNNLALFSRFLSYFNKDTLYTIRRLLNGIKSCHTEFKLSHADELAKQIDTEKIGKLIREVQNRIDFLNLSSTPTDLMSIISNEEVVNIIYEFLKSTGVLMDDKLFEGTKGFDAKADAKKRKYNHMTDIVKDIQKEIKRNKNHNQAEMVKLDELLKKIFQNLDINDLDNINEQLSEILEKMRKINEENEYLAKRYNGDYAFVKTYIDACETHDGYRKEDIAKALDVVYAAVKDIRDMNILVLQGRDVFANSVKKQTTAALLKSGIYKRLQMKDWYTDLLHEVYTNIKMF